MSTSIVELEEVEVEVVGVGVAAEEEEAEDEEEEVPGDDCARRAEREAEEEEREEEEEEEESRGTGWRGGGGGCCRSACTTSPLVLIDSPTTPTVRVRVDRATEGERMREGDSRTARWQVECDAGEAGAVEAQGGDEDEMEQGSSRAVAALSSQVSVSVSAERPLVVSALVGAKRFRSASALLGLLFSSLPPSRLSASG